MGIVWENLNYVIVKTTSFFIDFCGKVPLKITY